MPSPNGTIVAYVHQSSLVLRSSCDGRTVQSFSLPPNSNVRARRLRWSDPRRQYGINESPRLLVANDNSVHVFASDDANCKAVINTSASTTGGIANVTFGANEDEVVLFSDFGVKATIWSLLTSRGVEIRDPKPGSKCHAYRPTTRHLAILVRESAHDNLLLLAPSTYEVLENVELPSVDAQGLDWSPDGQWLAIWDNTSAGYKLYVYTADGNLFKTYAGGQTTDHVGLGIKSVTWSPKGDHLAIGDYEDCITFLNNKTVRLQYQLVRDLIDVGLVSSHILGLSHLSAEPGSKYHMGGANPGFQQSQLRTSSTTFNSTFTIDAPRQKRLHHGYILDGIQS